jgi:hypothetical protein
VPRGDLEVVEYVPRQGMLDAVPARDTHKSERLSKCFESRTLMSMATAFAAVALHVLFIGPVLWAGGISQQQQAERYRGDIADLQWVVLAESSGHSAIIRPRLSTSLSLTPIGVTDPLPPLRLSPPVGVSSSSAQPDGQSGLGAPYGRYLGQIRARIDRAWLRPRSAIGAPIFQCQVQVDQDSEGRVQEVTLLECNGPTPWQLSLVHAIQAASPLPAPSDPSLFVHHVLLAFRAVAYSSGQPAELYEPPRAAMVTDTPHARDSNSQNAFQTLREAAQARRSAVMKLQIEGSKVEVEPDRQ